MTNTPNETTEPDDEPVEIREYGTVPVYLARDGEQAVINISEAIQDATFPDEDPKDASLYFIPEEYEQMGLIPVQLMFGEMAKDGRSGGRWRSVEQTGTDEYSSFRVELSDEVLETLDIDPDDPEGGLVNLFAGDGVIALGKPEVREITIDADVDIVELLGPEAGRDYREVVINDRDPADVGEEHNRSQEMVEKNVRRAKDRKQDLEEAGIET